MSKRTFKLFMVVLITALFSCGSDEKTAEDENQDAAPSEHSRTPQSGDQPNSEGYRTASGAAYEADTETDNPPANGDENGTGGSTMAVDVGNPKDVGPKPAPNFKLWLADAPVDDLSSFILNTASITFIPVDSSIAPEQASLALNVDLLLYQGGAKLLLFEGYLPPGSYKEIHLTLKNLPVIKLQTGGADLFADLNNPVAPLTISTNTTFQVNDDGITELLWHVPLWKSLNKIAGQYIFDAVYPLLDLSAIGHLVLSGVDALGILSICVRKGSSGDLPILAGLSLVGDSDCLDAEGRSAVGGSNRTIPFLEPGSYVLDLYITDILYLRLPYLIHIDALIETSINL